MNPMYNMDLLKGLPCPIAAGLEVWVGGWVGVRGSETPPLGGGGGSAGHRPPDLQGGESEIGPRSFAAPERGPFELRLGVQEDTLPGPDVNCCH